MSALNTAGVNSESPCHWISDQICGHFVGVGDESLPQPTPMAAQVQTNVACSIASVRLNNYTLLVYWEPTVVARHWWRGAVTHTIPIGQRLNTTITIQSLHLGGIFRVYSTICLFHIKAYWLSWEEFRKHSVCLYAKKLEAFVQC